MTENKLYIPIILGTRRQGRMSEHVANYVQEKLVDHPEIETKLIDPRDLNFPADQDGREDLAKLNPDYLADIARSDGLVIVTPEHNHGIPGSLKMTLDLAYKEYEHKAVGLVTVSMGSFGGVRAAEALLPIVTALGLSQLQSGLTIVQKSI